MRAGFDGKRRPIKKELTKNKNVFDFLFIYFKMRKIDGASYANCEWNSFFLLLSL